MICRLKMRRLAIYSCLAVFLFLLLGGVAFVNGLLGAKMTAYDAYCVLTFPFAVVLFMLGLFGVRCFVKSRGLLEKDHTKAVLLLVGGFLLVLMVEFMLDFVAFPRG